MKVKCIDAGDFSVLEKGEIYEVDSGSEKYVANY